ncbi:hypothetical protein BH18GEM1_BH18GEM1_19840 [soil metagenome]
MVLWIAREDKPGCSHGNNVVIRSLGPAVALALVALGAPSTAPAQDRIDPAPAVRVVQYRDGATGETARWVTENPTPAEILRIQVELARAGYDPRVRSGALDGATRQALSGFQTARGIVICGCLTYETIVALGIRPQVVDFVSTGTRGDDYAGVTYDSYSQVIVAPGFFHRDPFHRHHRRFPIPGVVVGHEPAVGAGRLDRRPQPVSVGVREMRPVPPARSRPGGSIRSGSRPQRPIPR